ncbi:pentatricopeptide repeat-containing protein At1g71460, chloroplastic-like [Pyrus x bretschneideri]|uniref:pentatricopeptide repeat-containing protein At1g71460, chloroplastic-like n=1 Tax=Pyrus x bretschneideri TaxID=225117 RepID=UPI00202E6FC0|nr:pentatricopeptide repeat-containing protein At1g71460, chloroplastic-like [Pyrus x bretschneideri]
MIRVKSGFGSLPSKTQIRFLCTSVLDDPRPQSPFLTENLASFLDNCSDPLLLRKLHALIFARGLGNNIFQGCKLLNCYAKFDLLSDSRSVFDRIVNGNLSLWNAILVGILAIVKILQASQNSDLYGLMNRISLLCGTFALILQTFILVPAFGWFALACWAICFVATVSRNAILVGYFRAGQLDEVLRRCGFVEVAAEMFDEITERDIVVYTSIITGYAQSGDQRACEAFGFARHMQRQGLHPNRVTLVSLLQAALQLEEELVLDLLAATAMVDLYSKSNKLIQSRELFDGMEKKGSISYDVMMTGYLHNNYASEAVDTFVETVGEGIKPNLE